MGTNGFGTVVIINNLKQKYGIERTNNVPEDNNNSTIYGIAYMESWYHAKS